MKRKFLRNFFLNIFDKLLKKVEKIWKYILYQKIEKTIEIFLENTVQITLKKYF